MSETVSNLEVASSRLNKFVELANKSPRRQLIAASDRTPYTYVNLYRISKVHPLGSPAVANNLDSINLQTATYTSSMTGSSGHSAGVTCVNLSSPESAYSTGYSTDGTLSGASFPPEYYINIRTGKHYFQNNKNASRTKRIGDSNHSLHVTEDATVVEKGVNSGRKSTLLNEQPRDLRTSATNKCTEASKAQYPHQRPNCHLQQQQPQQRRHDEISHQKAEYHLMNLSINSLPIPYTIQSPPVAVPLQSSRQRSRIRTNPWLSANNSGYNSSLTLDETSSSSGLKFTESTGSVNDINVNIFRDSQTRRECRQESLSAGRSPVTQNSRIKPGMNIRDMKISLGMERCTKIGGRVSISCSSSNSSTSSTTESILSSDEDDTLNEMMGKFDESYVYEKETDILSDSDPTDCDDRIDSLSNVDTGQDGGDANYFFEKDVDYIDNRTSFLELEKMDPSGCFLNNRHCTFFTITNELGHCDSRVSFLKRRSQDERPNRSINVGSSAKRQSVRLKKMNKLTNEKPSNEKRKKLISQRRRRDEETANLNRALVEKMLLKNSGFNQGSRSVGGTPICHRRKKHDLDKNYSPIKQTIDDKSLISPRQFLVEKRAAEIVKRRSNSVSYMNGNLVKREISGKRYMATFASEIALIEADKEADQKYRELIVEAENILVNMQRNQNTSPMVASPSRKFHNGLTNKRVELIKNAELNIELALSKSRNSQPEMQSGNIKDLEHISPKRHFPQKNGSTYIGELQNNLGLFKENKQMEFPDSLIMCRRASHDSLTRGLLNNKRHVINNNSSINHGSTSNYYGAEHASPNFNKRAQSTLFQKSNRMSVKMREASEIKRGNSTAANSSKAESFTSSSSDSEERCELVEMEPLLNFRSIDMCPSKENISYCPQSEPVKRKVYAGSVTFGRIQKTLGENSVPLRNSDGDTVNEDTDDSRRSLREKVARLRQERLAAEAMLDSQETRAFQPQLSQIRRQMLMQTIAGLKRSLEDQSATLKNTCLEISTLNNGFV
ncbi:uncharacterized protein LOC117175527 [Belonocnema kinseyi]|uniref:uncharacterized protein LOC117175527 n=1 Tax=Belonocnema kinseyi TaxID=2817044 RepID=UPI00143CFE19|nr:uncharacterized protein LOC117175527 [Belonocnema kinseyi]